MDSRVKSALIYGGALSVGLLSGFFGGGGGMLCVPLLSYSGLSTKRAHATAMLVILPLCIVSAVIYIVNGYVDATAIICAVIGVSMGGALGALLLDKLNSDVVAIIFAALMIAIGVKLTLP